MLKDFNKIINISLLFLFTLIIFTFIKVPYDIYSTGGVLNLEDRISVKNYNCSGEYDMLYVTEINSNLLTYLLSMIIPDWDAVKITNDNINYDSSKDDIHYRGKILLDYSNSNAIYHAYRLANKKIKIRNIKFPIIYVENNKNTDLKVKDEIISINGVKITKYEDIKKELSKYSVGSKIKVNVRNNNKEYMREATINKSNKIGIVIPPIYEFDTKIDFKFKNDETGSSGGMMMTLALYDYLDDYDLAKGRIIAGTGTIEFDGEIGEISGLKYKLKAAIDNNAEIFLVSKYNYKEALKLKKENNYKIKIIKVNTIEDAINYLKK